MVVGRVRCKGGAGAAFLRQLLGSGDALVSDVALETLQDPCFLCGSEVTRARVSSLSQTRQREVSEGGTDRGDLAALVPAASKVGQPLGKPERVGDDDGLEVGFCWRELEPPVVAAAATLGGRGWEGDGAVGGEDVDELRARTERRVAGGVGEGWGSGQLARPSGQFARASGQSLARAVKCQIRRLPLDLC